MKMSCGKGVYIRQALATVFFMRMRMRMRADLHHAHAHARRFEHFSQIFPYTFPYEYVEVLYMAQAPKV